MTPPPRATPKITNHTAIWLLAIVLGGGLIAGVFLFHAAYEHTSGYPRGLRDFINHNEVLFLFGGGLLLIGLFVALGYGRGWFAKVPLQARVDLAAINARLDAAGVVTVPAALVHDRRMCYGTLALAPTELVFRCLHDEGNAAAAAGQAAARQFGLIGGLVSGAASAVRGHSRDKEIAAARAATDALPLDQQLAWNPHSFRIGAPQVGGLTRKSGARFLTTPKGTYGIDNLATDDLTALVAWCVRRGVHVDAM